MLKNNFKVIVNLFRKYKLYSFINIAGLAIGLACCILIFLYVRFELSYENGFANADRTYRISREYFPIGGARLRVPAANNGPVAAALAKDFPAIEAAGRITLGGAVLVQDEQAFTEHQIRFVDQEVLSVFDFEWMAGDPQSALMEPGTIVLTQSLAEKYFPESDPLGQSIGMQALSSSKAGDVSPLRVTGVIADLPENTHLSLSGMISMPTLAQAAVPDFDQSWTGYTDYYTYFLLREGESIEQIQAGIPDFLDGHIGEDTGSTGTMRIMNIGDIHLHSDRDEEWLPPGDIANVYSFGAIALGILLIACINFMSIATARSTHRSKEVGARLSLGASRGQLIVQFLGESFVTALVAFVLAAVLVEVLLPGFSAFIGHEFNFDVLGDIDLGLALLALVVFTALLSGSYPAFYLSARKPASVLKGDMGQQRNSLWLRNTMVTLQFSIAIALVISTVVIYLQRQFVNNSDIGFQRDNIVVLPSNFTQGYGNEWPAFKQALLQNPAVESVTTSHFLPFGWNDHQLPFRRRGTAIETRMQFMQVHTDFFSTYGIETLAGRVFSSEIASDALVMPTENDPFTRGTFVLNQSAARALGIDQQDFTEEELEIPGAAVVGTVLGIVEDTNFESLRKKVRPLVFAFTTPGHERNIEWFFDAAIRINPNAAAEALAHIDATWKTFYPDRLNTRYFLEQDFLAMYESDARQQQLLTWFSILAIVIAGLGLFGLASFNAERRTKEIGIRKVMGGSVWSIVVLLTNDFSKLVLLSNIIAWPVAYLAMQRWLSNFAYHIDLTPMIFIGSGLIALCIAWVTVGGTAAKAASQRPVQALRYE